MKTVALGDLVDAVSSWNPSRKPDNAFTYIDLSAVDSASKAVKGPVAVLGAEAPSRARQIVATRDVLVSTVRPNLNAVAVVPAALDGATASTGFTVLRPGRHLDGRYLFHWVRCPSFIGDMVRKATGASYPAVSDRIVKESLIPLPPLPEQRRIAAILDHADALRARRRQVLAHLDALTQSIFHDMFAADGYPSRPLEQVADPDDRINYGVVQPGDETPDGVPLIRVSDMVRGRIDRTNLKRISPTIEASYQRSRIRGNEILVSSVGSIGAVSVVGPADVGSNIARAITRVPVSDEVLRTYVAAYLRTSTPQHYFIAELRTVAQPTLNVGQLAATLIPLPPVSLQAEFRRRLQRVEELIHTVRTYILADDELFASLQSRAFDGRL